MSSASHDPLAELVAQRRKKLYQGQTPPGGAGLWGLALSGGGIRSATFCLGLTKALARSGALLRFDLLSTVSGGGYIGATLGKLFHLARTPEEVVRIAGDLASMDKRWMTWWLRANGRYLIPRGLGDAALAISVYLRNLVAIHIELGALGLLLGALLALFNLAAWPAVQALLPSDPLLRGTLEAVLAWLPAVWLLMLLQLPAAALLAAGYWTLQGQPGGGWLGKRQLLPPLLWAALAGLLWWQRPGGLSGGWPSALWWAWLLPFCAALAWVGALPLAVLLKQREQRRMPAAQSAARSQRLALEQCRLLLTRWLARLGLLALAVLLLGLVDRLAWYLVFEVRGQGWYGATLVGLAGLLRLLLPRLVPSSATLRPALGLSLATLGHLAGLLLLALLCIWWVSLAYALVFPARPDGRPELEQALAWALALALLSLAYILLGGGNVSVLNRSSLHGFYRARLVRSYLGAANGRRFGNGPGRQDPLAVLPGEPEHGLQVEAITEVDPEDDVEMHRYAPHLQGGPVHLINVCVNQTIDPRGGLVNQDRRGMPLTIAPLGLARVGQRPWRRVERVHAMSLGSWMAISGAAFAPGLGGMTRIGVAALATIAGLRLGYWWDSAALQGGAAPRPASRRFWAGKSRLMLAELLAQFNADPQRHWYLSDGGHYENTGAYALLAAQAELIVVADCGADPRYGFSDLENLVRKARIDLQTELRFLRPRLAEPSQERAPDCFGSLADLASPQSLACVALASIRYRRSGASGLMVVVKPNLCAGLPVDLLNFKRENPGFPQQPTTDQSFDEAQWESYFTLGDQLGRTLGDSMLERLPALAARLFVPDDGTPVGRSAATAPAETSKPAAAPSAPSRMIGGAVATVGLSAATTLGVSLWQVLDSWRDDGLERARVERSAQQALAELYARLDGSGKGGEKELAALVAALLRAAEAECPADGAEGWFQRSALAQCALRHAEQLCVPMGAKVPICGLLLEQPQRRCLDQAWRRRSNEDQPRYWNLDLGMPQVPACRPLPSALPAPLGACAGVRLYGQAHGAAALQDLRRLTAGWRAQGLLVQPEEDMLDAAQRRGRRPPQPYALPTLIAHDPAALACAEQLRAQRPDWQLHDLPAGLRRQPGMLELWWPPARKP